MHYLEENNMDGLLLLVDFEKAFDSIEWKLLRKALNSFNVGPSICNCFKTTHTTLVLDTLIFRVSLSDVSQPSITRNVSSAY
jgi:hypothetical protein